MITLRKLKSLPEDTRLRKIVRLLDGCVRYSSLPDPGYLGGIIELIREALPRAESDIADALSAAASAVSEASSRPTPDSDPALRAIDDLRHALRAGLGIPVGDWDLLPPAGFGPTREFGRDETPCASDPGAGDGSAGDLLGTARPIGVYLESIRSPFNVGSIIRTAAALGIGRVGMSPDCPPSGHPRLVRSARGAERWVEISRVPVTDLDATWRPLVALEVGGQDVHGFPFPAGGTLLVGSEELGLSQAALEAADAIIGIHMHSVKGSLNVGVACGIALHAWCVTQKMTDLSGQAEPDV